MSALLFIQERRKSQERIDFVSMVRIAMNPSQRDVEKAMEGWARDAEIRLMFD